MQKTNQDKRPPMISKYIVPIIIISLITHSGILLYAHQNDEITPHKYTEKPSAYDIPPSARLTVKRAESNTPDIVYYFSKPQVSSYPIAVLCGGSTERNDIRSIIHFHRYFLQEFIDIDSGVLTIEQWGIDGNQIDEHEFMDHYTRTQRLNDHKTIIDYLQTNPPAGWNGKLIFLGVSEGGPLVTELTITYSRITMATVNWAGAGDCSWQDQLWTFMQDMRNKAPWWFTMWDALPKWLPFALDIPKTRSNYDACMDAAQQNPCTDTYFLGMTYAYHADTMSWPATDYQKINTPFLVVAGAQDSIIKSCDIFVEKAIHAGAKITYLRIPDMDHYIRHRPDIIEKSFAWLKEQIY